MISIYFIFFSYPHDLFLREKVFEMFWHVFGSGNAFFFRIEKDVFYTYIQKIPYRNKQNAQEGVVSCKLQFTVTAVYVCGFLYLEKETDVL